MRRTGALLVSGLVVLTAAGAHATSQQRQAGSAGAATHGAAHFDEMYVVARDADGDRVGTIWMSQAGGAVRVSARFHSLTEGFHGFHVHQVGSCEPGDPATPFTGAGGHHVGTGGAHGDHDGDLPSLLVRSDGRAQLSFVTEGFSLQELRDADGSAVMVHSGPDNFANIPARYSSAEGPGPDDETRRTGDAGARVACGVVPAQAETVRVAVTDTDGRAVGTVALRPEGRSVRVTAQLHSLPPGFHGFHVHETGRCQSDENPALAFLSAGGHYPGGHAQQAQHAEHAGDLPPLRVMANGRARLSFLTDRFTMAELRDADGSAVMVHAGPDNFANIPARYSSSTGQTGPDPTTLKGGDSGDRAACGVIAPAHRS